MRSAEFHYRSPVLERYEARSTTRRQALRVLAGGAGVAAGLGAAIGVVDFYLNSQINSEKAKLAKKVTAKLDGQIPLAPDEMLYPGAQIVASGINSDEVTTMIKEQTPINVRDYPSTYDPRSGKPSFDPVGVLEQGTTIINVLLVLGVKPDSPEPGYWGAFKGSAIQGTVTDKNKKGQSVKIDPNGIYYIYGIYIKKLQPLKSTINI